MSRLPQIHVQLWNGTHPTVLASPLFARPEVVPYLEAFYSFGDVNSAGGDALDRRTPEKRAEDTFITVKAYRDVMRAAHPTVPFRWSWWPHRFGDALSIRQGADGKFIPIDRLCRHEADHVPGIGSSMFVANSIATHGPHVDRMVGHLATLLVRDGTLFPLMVDADYEGGAQIGDWGVDYKGHERWHPAIMAQSRSRTHAIAASGLTYAEYMSKPIDIEGKPITGAPFPYIYDEARWREVCVMSSISTMVVDHALNSTLYSAVRKYMPRTLCGNWGTFAATRKHTSHLYRYRESPVDAGPHLGADLSIAACYGTPFNDGLKPGGTGRCSWEEHCRRLRIDPAGYKNATDLAVDLHIKHIEYLATGSLWGKPPTARNAISLAWCGAGMWNGYGAGPLVFNDASRHPPQLLGGTLDYNAPGVAQRLFDVLRRAQVTDVEIFAQPCGTTEFMRAGFDKMATTLAGVR